MKIAFVVQRYGTEVNGGAEFHCRKLAENLITDNHVSKITVLTSCARDHSNWTNYFDPGESELNGIKVFRFPTSFSRLGLIQKSTGLLLRLFKIKFIEKLWFIAQGPFVPNLLKYIKTHNDDYDIFIFFTYLFYPTVFGLPLVKDKAILIPTAHDEPAIYFNYYKEYFNKPRAIAYNTFEEAKFVQNLFSNQNILSSIVGCGIDFPEIDNIEYLSSSEDPYILYLGRIDEEKNVQEMFDGFITFKSRYGHQVFIGNDGKKFKGKDLKLVLAGRKNIAVPRQDDIICLGFISEKEKNNLLRNSILLVMPSKRESLSLVILEAWARETPVIVHEQCEVTNGQNNRAHGGVSYSNAINFSEALTEMLIYDKKRIKLANNGKTYTQENYSWNIVTLKLIKLINKSISKDNL